jgi:hypothetical protein
VVQQEGQGNGAYGIVGADLESSWQGSKHAREGNQLAISTSSPGKEVRSVLSPGLLGPNHPPIRSSMVHLSHARAWRDF